MATKTTAFTGPVVVGLNDKKGEIRLTDGKNVNEAKHLSIAAPDTITSNTTLTFPDGAGTNGQVLTTDGNGGLSWTTSGGGAGNPGGTVGQTQVNDGAGGFGAISEGTSGQVLTSDGSTAFWQDAGNGGGCSVVETIRGYPVRMRLECGSDTYIVNGSTLNSKSLSKPNEWTSSFHCAIDISENPVCWGDDSYGQISDTPTNVLLSSLSTGQNHNCGLDTSGQVHCWGYDGNGVVSNAPSVGSFTHLSSLIFSSLCSWLLSSCEHS